MTHTYNRVAGQSKERMAALSDGIFGVGMTLLVLDLKVPAHEITKSDPALLSGLVAVLPSLLIYAMSFLTLGIFWVGQQTQHSQLARSDRHLTWINLAFLFAVTLMPFSTKLLAEFRDLRTALLAYWFNILLLGGGLYASWGYAYRAKLLVEGTAPQVVSGICQRILFAQTLYACGALLCFVDTRLSIGVIVLVQLFYAVAPGFRPGKA